MRTLLGLVLGVSCMATLCAVQSSPTIEFTPTVQAEEAPAPKPVGQLGDFNSSLNQVKDSASETSQSIRELSDAIAPLIGPPKAHAGPTVAPAEPETTSEPPSQPMQSVTARGPPEVGHIDISGMTTADVKETVNIRINGFDPKQPFKWTIIPQSESVEVLDFLTLDGAYVRTFKSRVAGTFVLVLSTFSEGHLDVSQHTIVVGPAVPVPPPPDVPVPVPTPVDKYGIFPAVSAVFATQPTTGKQDAETLGGVAQVVAEMVQQDGASPTPRFQKKSDVIEFYRVTQAQSLDWAAGRYPAYAPIAAKLFDEHWGADDGVLSADVRAKAVDLLQALSAACRKAAQ